VWPTPRHHQVQAIDHRGLAGWSTGPWHLHQLTGCPRPAFLFPGKGGPSLIAASPPPRPHLPGATCPPLHGFQQQLRHAMCTLFSNDLLVFLKRYGISLSRPYFVSKTQADSPSHNLHDWSSDYLFLPANETARCYSLQTVARAEKAFVIKEPLDLSHCPNECKSVARLSQ
jgi:hypothetical protein